MKKSDRVAMYFLFGGDDDEREVYIGQTGDLRSRLKSHNNKKDFWERALILISWAETLTQTHALFLEWLCLKKAQNAGRYNDLNGNNGSKPHTPAPLEAECYELFETGSTLLATLGYPIFSPPVALVNGVNKKEFVYHCTVFGSSGRGLYTPEGFVVLKGSIGRLANVKSMQGTASERYRERLLKQGVMVADGDRVVFTKDYLFNSPSMAAIAIAGRTMNGWKRWKTDDGRTLHDIERADDENAFEQSS